MLEGGQRSGPGDEPRNSSSGAWNIDGVIPREPWEEPQRNAGMQARFDTLERRLYAAIDRVEDIPVSIERRMASMESELRQRLEDFELTVSAVERVAGTELPGRLAEFAGALSTLQSRVADLGSLVAELAGSVAQHRADAGSSRQEVAAAARSVEARVVASVHGATDAFLAEAQETINTAHVAGSRLERLTDRVEELRDILGEHRLALQSTLQRDRTALLNDVIEVVIDALPPRRRRAVADKLLVRERRREAAEADSAAASHAAASTPGDQAPRTSPSATNTPPALTAGAAADAARDSRTEGTDNPGHGPPASPPIRMSARSGEVERAELKQVVMEVRGIGPARAETLADAFSTLERLWVADADEIVAATDLPRARATAVIEHLHSNYDYRR